MNNFCDTEVVHRHNINGLDGYLGDIPPAQFEAALYTAKRTDQSLSKSNNLSLHQNQVRFTMLLGPAFVAAIAYVDPG